MAVANFDDFDDLEQADGWHRKGVELYSQGHFEAALEAFQQALQIAGEYGVPWSLFDAGKCLFQMGRYDEAIASLRLAKEIMPHELWPYIELAKVFYTRGNEYGAIETLKAAIQRPNASLGALDYVTVGQVFLQFANLKLASAYFHEALYRDENNADAILGLEQITTLEITPVVPEQEPLFAEPEKKTKQRGRPKKTG